MPRLRALVPLCVAACAPACAPPASTAPSPAAPSAFPARDEARPPFCVYALASPVVAAGSLSGYFGPAGEDCVPPDGGPLFTVGFGVPGRAFTVTAVRSVGEHPLAPGSAFLDYVGPEGACEGWTGALTISADAPDWAVTLEARCASTGVHLDATLSGSWPPEWR